MYNKVVKLEFEEYEKNSFLILDGQSRICNWLYNRLLEYANSTKSTALETNNLKLIETIYTQRGLRNLIPDLKKEHPFLKTVHSSPLKNVALRLSSSIQDHQKSKKGKRKGDVTGWPKFKAWQANWFSLLYDEPKKGFKVTGDILRISYGVDKNKKRLFTTFRLKEAHRLKGYDVRNLRIVKECGVYYAIFSVQVTVPEKKPIAKALALDPNHKNFAYGVDTDGNAIEIQAPHWLKTKDKQLDELKSKRDRCLKKSKKLPILDDDGQPIGQEYYTPSRKWRKYQNIIEKIRHKRQEQTKTFMFTLAHDLCKSYDLIGIGSYTPLGNGITKAMRRSMNNRSLNRRFKATLSWVATKSGKTFIEYDETGTTRTCHSCGYVVEGGLEVSIRQWTCSQCRCDHLRDENSAILGLRKILKDHINEAAASQVPCSGLVCVNKRCAWCVLPSGIKKVPQGQSRIQLQRQEIKPKAVPPSTKSCSLLKFEQV
jgi:putative transposase